jgi:guanylate kinase
MIEPEIQKRSLGSRIFDVLKYVILILATIVAVTPVVVCVFTAFKTEEEYQKMIANGEFLETAEVYNNFYGTPKAPVYEKLSLGHDVMFEIDTWGAKQVKRMYPEAVSIFIIPPSYETLEKRLRARGTDSEETIKRRLSMAKSELAKYKQFDYIVFNDDLEVAIERVLSIIESEKCKMDRNEEIVNEYLATMPSKKK